jgi:hypothetical protein
VAVPATLLRIVKEHQKQVVRVASIAGELQKRSQRASEAGKKGGKTVTAIVIADPAADCVRCGFTFLGASHIPPSPPASADGFSSPPAAI